MKSILVVTLSLLLVCFTVKNGHAQTININPKLRLIEGPNAEDVHATAQFTNNTTDSLFKWNVIEYNIPADWQFDFCDPYNCVTVNGLTSNGDFILRPGKSGGLKGDFYFKAKGGSGNVKIRFYATNNPQIADTFTMISKAWNTGLSKVKKSSDVAFFPNPASKEITLIYATSKPLEVTVYDVLGNSVKTFTHQGNETLINLDDLQKGMYFIRFMDNGNLFSKSFTKSE